jgi:DnaK suppressor protein
MSEDFTAAELEHFRALLERRRAELQRTSASADEARRTVELDQTRQGRLSRIDALQGQEMSKAAERRRQQELTRIDSAFRRLESGDFGYCAHCDEPIGKRRLEADPTTPVCIDCAEGGGR